MGKGLIIAFEGMDGCGKDTQIDLLKEYFDDQSIRYKYIPQLKTKIGELTRQEYLSGNVGEFPYRNRINELLFTADRLQYVFGPGGVVDSVNDGNIVILNRYVLSGLVYALFNKGAITSPEYKMYESYINELNKPILEKAYPDVTFYLKISPHDSMERIKTRAAKKEVYEQEAYASNMYEKFEHIVHSEMRQGKDIMILDGTKPIDIIQKYIREYINFKIGGNK